MIAEQIKLGMELMCTIGMVKVVEPVPKHPTWWRCTVVWTWAEPRHSSRKAGDIEAWEAGNLREPGPDDVKPENKYLKYGE